MLKLILLADDSLAKIEKALLTALVCAMLGLSSVQVVLRVAFSQGILWADPLLRHMVLWTGLTGAVLAAREGRHFVLDLAEKLLPPGLRRPLSIFSGLFSCAVCALLLYAALKFLRDERTAASAAFSIGQWAVQSYWLEAALAPAFALILFHTLAGLARKK